MNTPLLTLELKQIAANPIEAIMIKGFFKAYRDGKFERICVGDLEEGKYFIADWYELTKAEQKAFNKFTAAVYEFHKLDENLQYVNQENHFKVYGYYESTTAV
jgi:hypothetical protein